MLERTSEKIYWLDKKYEDNFNELVLKLKSSDVFGVFIGAGLSKGIYLDWDELVDRLSELLRIKKDDSVDPPIFMERCKNNNEQEYYRHLNAIFNPESKRDYNPSHIDILSIIFSGSFITTNIDVCMRNAARTLNNGMLASKFPLL